MASPSISRDTPTRGTRSSAQSPIHSPLSYRHSPRWIASPRHPLQLDLERTLSEIQLHDEDLHKVRLLERQQYQEELRSREVASAKVHNAALEAAQKYREAIRLEAENVLQRHIEQEAEARRKALEVEQQRQREMEAAEAERDRKLRENAARLDRLERERKQREVQEKAEKEAEARKREEERNAREEAEKKNKKQEEVAEKARQDAEAEMQRRAIETIQRTQQTPITTAQPQTAQLSAPKSRTVSNAEVTHKEYLILYEKIKQFKNAFAEEVKAYPKAEKEPVGEGRRLIKSSVGKLSYGETKANQVTTEQIKKCIISAFSNTTRIGRPVPVNDLLPSSLNLHDNNQQTIPAFAVYLLALLAQHVCKIFTSYVHGEPQRAEPIGICMTAIFGWDKLQFQRMNPETQQVEKIGLFSVLLAKYHKMCPALFGITGDQTTAAGKRKLGWQLIHGTGTSAVERPGAPMQPMSYEASRRKVTHIVEADESTPKNTFCLENVHYDRMKGLAIGYSALALRNVSNSKTLVNPYPPRNFWLSLAQIVNMPPNQVQPTHMCVLRYMFGHNGVGRFLLFFGAVGVAVLRQAFIDFPRSLPSPVRDDSFTKECQVYVEKDLAEKMHFHLI